MPTTRTLVLMRHGKSAYPDGVDDHDRPLAPRGQREAALGGQWIRANLPTVETVLCSTAQRTRETLEAAGIEAPVDYARSLYGAYPQEIIEELALLDDSVRTAMVVAHFPGIPETALALAENSDSELADKLASHYPTSAIAVLEFSVPWSQLAPRGAELTHFHIPR